MLVEQIDQTIIIALIGVLGGVLPVGITYVLTKNKEINASIREEKTKRYDGLIEILVQIARFIHDLKLGLTDQAAFFDAVNSYIAAYHRASTYASDDVLLRCNDFMKEFIEQLDKEDEDLDIVIEKLRDRIIDIYEAIRLDINPKAKYSRIGVMWVYKIEEKVGGAPIK